MANAVSASAAADVYASVLVVDDEPAVRDLIGRILVKSGYEVVDARSGQEAIESGWLEQVDLVVSDIHMPGVVSGLNLLEALRTRRPNLPVILITGSGHETHVREALDLGAAGFLPKPFTAAELREKVATALDRVRLSEVDLRERLLAPTVASVLANAIEVRDGSMAGHTERLAGLALEIGRLRGLSESDREALELGALLHDVGKIGIPDRILLKPGPLTQDERTVMRTHAEIGDRMLAPLELLENVRPVVRHHHERWDGTGYPDRLAGDEIPLLARIVAVADSTEAMSGERPYRVALSGEAVLRELHMGRGSQWDPALVDLLVGLIDQGRLEFRPGGMSLLGT
jgi:putative two-component system response regulator